MDTVEEPVISRLDRLDNVLRQLEIMKGGYHHSPKSSTASTTSGDETPASEDFSPKSLEKHCRSIEVVRMETGVKGTVMDRLALLEDRILKLEEEIETENKKKAISSPAAEKTSSPRRNSLKQLVKSCIKGKKKS